MRDPLAPAVSRPVPLPAATGAARRSGRRWPVRLLAAALLAQMAFAMVTTALRQTPTIDEPVYVGAAAEYVYAHRLRHNPEHPPLGKLLIGAGVVLADPHVDRDFTGDQGRLGRHLLYESGNDPWWLMLWARLPVIALTLLFGLVVLAFARELAGDLAGSAALALYCFSPDVIAHGSLATLDVPAAGFVLTSAWLVWRARRRPLPYVPLAGLALGAALATRMSTLPAVPVLAALAALPVAAGSRRGVRALTGAGVFVLAAVAVVWASYLAVDPRLRWAPEQHVPVVHGLRGLLVRLLPFPEAYRDGVRLQFGLENRPWQGFLFGRVYDGSLWYYLPAALLVKTPLGTAVLWAGGVVAVAASRRLRPAAPCVLAAPAVLLAAAVQGQRDLGVRYVVFLPLFLAVAAGCVLLARRRWVTAAVAVLVACAAVSSVRAYPCYLPYANEAFGGPGRTREWLHDSNVDWGQDLGRLAERLRERYAGQRVWLVYKGAGVPEFYGIRSADPRRVPVTEVRGLLVVSDSAAAKATGRLAELLGGSRPVDRVGHAITIYRR
ncbi:ArnT family glycosyltransferase [Streptomyces sp. NPDC057794]|uniref:ArnT family glycosyltransferase n=1 Tax=Streptomyces sp. NPDC057794 TaxID=3346251 RepID=UPI0036979543